MLKFNKIAAIWVAVLPVLYLAVQIGFLCLGAAVFASVAYLAVPRMLFMFILAPAVVVLVAWAECIWKDHFGEVYTWDFPEWKRAVVFIVAGLVSMWLTFCVKQVFFKGSVVLNDHVTFTGYTLILAIVYVGVECGSSALVIDRNIGRWRNWLGYYGQQPSPDRWRAIKEILRGRAEH